MSKMDGLRAMREAKYAAAQKAAKATKPAARPKVAPEAKPSKAAAAAKALAADPGPVTASEELCGHRNMSGRTCTREAGHAAKSHRYS
ncbi:hypothetical protein [Nocardioides sp. cx-173]|uniref:hypothetical protein n=1 Tax=Nocardioides sp. cx-173 TaxID=2898796 RepID=UPI001E55AFE8|nr:hypothetical protein [Nocardioides sp. cx-173]MCD4524719.1 hypothetical protein [Nocardioides sp. cx-173]UGB43229.1 hypothetical protein LQ940_06785 [Nocardioides sp. cx-173]